MSDLRNLQQQLSKLQQMVDDLTATVNRLSQKPSYGSMYQRDWTTHRTMSNDTVTTQEGTGVRPRQSETMSYARNKFL